MQAESHTVGAAGHRFITLDALRGIAALGVALFHYDGAMMPRGFMAVDFFFVLSGFVLARTYEPRFGQGLGAWAFTKARAVRLYPLYLLGTAIGSVYAVQHAYRVHPEQLPALPLQVAFNVLALPAPYSDLVFPVNAPAWSLFCEMAVNIVMACGLVRLANRPLALIAAAAGVGLIVAAWLTPTTDGAWPLGGGPDWATFHVGILRTAFSFCVGMLIARLHQPALRQAATVPLVLCAVLVAAMAVAVPAAAGFAFNALFVFAISPLLVLVGRAFEPGPLLRRLGTTAGDLSFAVYAIHMPISAACAALAAKLGLDKAWFAPVYVAVVLVGAQACVTWFDRPVRQVLAGMLLRSPAAARKR